jgi:hypothetical protein
MQNEMDHKRLASIMAVISPAIPVFRNDPLAKLDLQQNDVEKELSNYNRRFEGWQRFIPVKDAPNQVWFGVWRANLPDDITDVLDKLSFDDNEDPEDYKLVSSKLIAHLTNKPGSKYQSRAYFRGIRQAEDEPFSSFYDRLKTASESCGWNEEAKRESMIEQVIAGQFHERLRAKLLVLHTDDIDNYVKECEAFERAAIHAAQLPRPTTSGWFLN